MKKYLLSVHLGAHDLDPVDSEDCAQSHEEPIFVYFPSNPVGYFFKKKLGRVLTFETPRKI